jgi:hypothetical protein
MRARSRLLVLGMLCAVSAFGGGGHGTGNLEMFNIGEAMGVTDPNVPKLSIFRSNVDPGHFESGSADGEPVPVISVTAGKDGKRAIDDGTGRPSRGGATNDERAVIDESARNAPLAKVEPNTRPFSASNGDGKPALAVAQYDDNGNVKTVTLKDGTKVDFTGKGLTDADIDRFLKDPNKNPLVGNNGSVRRALDASGGAVTCQG